MLRMFSLSSPFMFMVRPIRGPSSSKTFPFSWYALQLVDVPVPVKVEKAGAGITT
jgi:hypothetical protein